MSGNMKGVLIAVVGGIIAAIIGALIAFGGDYYLQIRQEKTASAIAAVSANLTGTYIATLLPPTPTATVPTPTPVPPTPTAIVPTSTPVPPTATATITSSPSSVQPTPTTTVLTPIPEPSGTSVAEQQPEDGVLFERNFENGRLDAYTNRGDVGTWSVVDDGTGNNVLENIPLASNYQEWYFGEFTWTNYAVEFKFRFIDTVNPFAIHFRELNNEYYVFFIESNGQVSFQYHPYNGSWHPIEYNTYNFIPDRWYQIRIEANEDLFRAYVDDRLVSSVRDDRFYEGYIDFNAFPRTTVQIDDIRVTSLVE